MLKKLKGKQEKVVDGVRIEKGEPVLDKTGNYIGKVRETRRKGFVVDRSEYHYPDVLVPYSACITDGPGNLKLEITVKEFDQQGWETIDPSK